MKSPSRSNSKPGAVLEMEQSCWQKTTWSATSLAVQWLRTHLPKQATQAQSPVQEESTCYMGQLSLRSTCWAHVPQWWKPPRLRAHAPQQEKPCVQQQTLSTALSPQTHKPTQGLLDLGAWLLMWQGSLHQSLDLHCSEAAFSLGFTQSWQSSWVLSKWIRRLYPSSKHV